MNNFNYFAGITSPEAAKVYWKKLAMKHHPDRPGGDLATMQIINDQYDRLLKSLDGFKTFDKENKEHTYRYNEATEAAIMEFIDRLIKSRILNNPYIICEIVGTWVWIYGNEEKPDATKDFSAQLGKKEGGLGCSWIKNRGKWAYTPEPKKGYYSKSGYDSIKARYGSAKVQVEREKSIA